MEGLIKGAPIRSQGLLSERTADGIVIVSPTSGRLRVLNPLGASIWSLLDGSRTVCEIKLALQQQFAEVPATQIQHDLVAFLKELMKRGLITGIED